MNVFLATGITLRGGFESKPMFRRSETGGDRRPASFQSSSFRIDSNYRKILLLFFLFPFWKRRKTKQRPLHSESQTQWRGNFMTTTAVSTSPAGIPCLLFDLSKNEKATCFSLLAAADKARIAQEFLTIGSTSPAAGFQIHGRSYSSGKKHFELRVLAIGDRESQEQIEMPTVGPKGCPFHRDLDLTSSSLVQRMVTLSGNILLATTECRPHIFACNPDEVVAFFDQADRLMGGVCEDDEKEPADSNWSGAILSQVGVVGGQTVPHAHVHVTQGIKASNA